MSSDSQPQKRNFYLLIVLLIIGILVGALAVGFWMGSKSSQTPQTQTNQPTLTIASFKSEVEAEDTPILAYLDLEIHNYGVNGNNVSCTGRVRWHTDQYTLEGLSVCMYIMRNYTKTNAVDVEVVAYGGLLLLPSGTIDSDSVSVPKLGETLFSYDFSLTCTYH